MAESKIEDLFTNLKEYVNLQYDILRLQLVEKISGITSNLISFLLLAFFALVTFLFLSLALALYLSQLFLSQFQGFLVVAAGYALITVFFVYFRKPIIRDPLRDKMIRELLKDLSEEKKETR